MNIKSFIFIFFLTIISFNARAAITYVTSITDTGNDDKASLIIPALAQAGDVLIAQVVIRDRNGGDSVSAESDWILIGSQNRAGDALQSIYYKIASTGDAGKTYRWDFEGNGNRRYILGISIFRGGDTINPIADENSSGGFFLFNSVTAPSVTTTRLNSYLIAAYTVDDGRENFSPSTGMSEQYDVQTNSNNGLTAMIARELWQPISATGSRTSIVNSFFGYGIGHLIALNENLGPSISNTLTSCSNLSTISLEFSELLDPITAENINNYSLVSAGGNIVSITDASLASDTVTLTLGETLNDLTPYTLTVNNVEDLYGNSIPSNSSASFSLSCGINCISDNFVGPGDLSNSWSVGNSRGSFGNPKIVENGRLRLTDASNQVATVATLLNQFPGADNRIEVEFDYYAYGGNGADGISVNFSDAAITPRAGAYGGSLGYAQQNSINGFAGGWMGVGIDEYGNFSAANEGKSGGVGFRRDAVAIRGSGSGSGSSEYPYLEGTGSLSPEIDQGGNNPNPGHRYKITIDHTAGGGVAMASVSRDTGSGYQLIIPEFNVFGKNTDQAPVPENWVVSFTGSTGGSTNIHEIGDLKVCAAQPIQTFVVVDHYDIDVMSPGLTCEGSKVTITAHDINHDPVDQLSDTNINISTTPSVNAIIPSTVTMLAGTSTASFYLQQTSALANVDIDLTDGNFTDKEGTNEDPRISFLDAAFRFYADGSNTDTNPIATQISGKPSNLAPNNQSLALRAVRTNTDTGACEAGLAGPQTVSFAYNCVDPDSCSATQLSITADETKPIAGTSTGNVLAYSNLDMVFDANGSAPFSFTFSDAGKIQLHATLTVPEPSPNPDFDPAFTLTGSSNEFVVRPFAFDLGLTGDYQASSSSGTRFVSAGSDFPMTVRAVNWQANDDTNSDGIPDTGSDVANNSSTPNFGQELNGSAQSLAITHTLTLPNPGNVGNLSSTPINTSASAGFFTAGVAGDITQGNPAVNLSWDEVGIIDLDVSLNNYLSAAGANVTGIKTNVGRFYPASFSLTSSALTNSCVPTGGNSFSYMSQLGIGVSYELEARNTAGAKTLNYDGGFAKATLSLVAENNNEGVDYEPRLSGFGSTNWDNGDYTFSRTGSFNRLASGTPNVLDGPYRDLKIGLQLVDNDGNVSALNGLNMRADSSADCGAVGVIEKCNALALAGNLDVRFGQLKLNNVFGPETSNLDMTVQTEYFDGTRFVVNTDDSCTVLLGTDPPLIAGSYTDNLDDGEMGPNSLNSNLNITSGLGSIQFSASGLGNSGSVIFEYAADDWLKTENTDDGDYADNPFGKVTFGQFRGTDRVIYWREIVR